MQCHVDYEQGRIILNGIPFAFEAIENHGWNWEEIKAWADDPSRAWVAKQVLYILIRERVIS